MKKALVMTIHCLGPQSCMARKNRLPCADSEIAQLNSHGTRLMKPGSLLRDTELPHRFIQPYRFPVGLLSGIFECRLPEHNEPGVVRAIKGPLLLTQICTRWRTIALSTQAVDYKIQPTLQLRDGWCGFSQALANEERRMLQLGYSGSGISG
jgi:hypothetical protein